MVDSKGGWGAPMPKKKKNNDTQQEPQQQPKLVEKQSQPTTVKKDTVPDTCIELIARAKEGIYFVDEKANNYYVDESKILVKDANHSMFSKDGSYLYFAT
mmetsp:Transcript_25171/g.22200  ORF Transcript_25171/g.22200 Transcript_25171/m.22200 type:complete len:100 (+) Transcript_25171:54-353(+)